MPGTEDYYDLSILGCEGGSTSIKAMVACMLCVVFRNGVIDETSRKRHKEHRT